MKHFIHKNQQSNLISWLPNAFFFLFFSMWSCSGSNDPSPSFFPNAFFLFLVCGLAMVPMTPPPRDRDMDWDRDRTFCCGPSRGIGLSAVAPPAGSDFPLWPLLQDQTFRCGPSRGSDFPMWPLPGDRTFRCGPSRRIESYGVALRTGSTTTSRDHLNIL